MKYLKTLFILIFSFCSYLSPQPGEAQQLQRKGFLGIQFNRPTAKNTKGLSVRRVRNHSTAQKLGVKTDDVLLAINSQAVSNFAALRKAWNSLRKNNPVTLSIERGGKTKTLKGKVVGRPLQASTPQTKVIYDQMAFRKGKLSIIVSRPRNTERKKYPAIMFIPGYTCSSVDNMPARHPYRKWLDGLEQKGYVVFRVEKPGMGDCDGTPECRDIDFKTEVEAFVAGYKKLLTYDFIDKKNIFIIGHSMGGVIAPLLSAQFQPKGVIVYGTLYSSWFEYCLRMFRFQNPHTGVSFEENEKDMRVYPEFLRQFLIKKKSPQELAKNPHFKKLLVRDHMYQGGDAVFNRHYSYWQGIQDLKLMEAWKNTSSYVFSIFGEADFEALDPTDHRRIVEIVNHYHPGKATYTQLDKTNHGLRLVGTMDEWLQRKRNRNFSGIRFNNKIIEITDRWIQSIMLK